MIDSERLRWGVTAHKTHTNHPAIDVQNLYVDIPEKVFDPLTRMPGIETALGYLTDSVNRIDGFHGQDGDITRLRFGPRRLSTDIQKRHEQLVCLARIIEGLDNDEVTEPDEKDIRFRARMGSVPRAEAKGYPLSVEVGWVRRTPDQELELIAARVGQSLGAQLEPRLSVITYHARAHVSRSEGVKLTTRRSGEAGAWTSPAYQPPNRAYPKSERFRASGFNLASLDESLICLGMFTAMAHPEGLPKLGS